MPGAARITDTVNGTTAGEHSGHAPPHPPGAVQRGDLRGLFAHRADQRPGRRYGGEHHHRAGRVLRVKPGRRGRRERDREDRRVSHGNRNTGAKNHF